MMTINLYDDQLEFVHDIRKALAGGSKSVLGVASTGMGKTVVSAYIARSAKEKGKTVWFLCHRKNLFKQTTKAFWQFGIEHGIIASGRTMSKLPVMVATVGTLARRLDKLTPPDLLIVDEAHLAMAETWKRVVDWAKESGAIVLGNSATPERLDGKGLDYLFDTMVEAKPMRWLIDNGRLSDYVMYTAMQPDLSEVKKLGGDYNQGQLEKAMDKPVLIGDAVSHYKRYASGLRTIAYCVTVKHSQHTADAFNSQGVPAVHVDGESSDAELMDAINGFADGRYMVLCNCQLMTEGFDLSAQVGRDVPIEACILLRPTQSLALYMQMVGRALRVKPRPAVILDHAGCALRHGLPDDDRNWSLAGRKKGRRSASDEEPDVNIQQCGKCFAVFRPGADVCPACGEPIPKQERKDIETADGELVQVDIEAIRRERKREQGRARTLRDLVELGVRKGMKKPHAWAANVLAARERRKPTPEEFNQAREYANAARN